MFPWWVWALLTAAVVVMIILAMMWWRARTLTGTPGSFAARYFPSGEMSGRGRRVVVSYNETSVELFMMGSLSPVARMVFYRHLIRMDRLDPTDDYQYWVRLHDEESSAQALLQMPDENLSELSTWIESGPMIGIGHWREAPRRKQRRRYF